MGNQQIHKQQLTNLRFSCPKQFSKPCFQYLSPISQIDVTQPMESSCKIETVHDLQYWEIENNQLQMSQKEMQKIQEIKVKWNAFIKMKKMNYLDDYLVLRQIGRGGYGCVHKVKAKYTGLYRAAKRIKKSELKGLLHQKLFQQMAIMMSLDHPNIAKLYQVYDYKSYYILILQLCQGGQLFKKIVTKQTNQSIAGKIMKQMLRTLIYLHKKKIVHRDLKPQNMLFDQQNLKIIDFGIAIRKSHTQQMLFQRIGTPYYIAPEVLSKYYNQKCDIWSAGVILYMMICRRPPFWGDNQAQVMQNVITENVLFTGAHWIKVSTQCKELILWMLKKNPTERPTAEQAFNHVWIQRVVQQVSKKNQTSVIQNIRGFSFQNKLQAVVYTYIVSQLLTTDQKKFLIQIFKDLDVNNDGVIQSSELLRALKVNKSITNDRVQFLMRIIDTNDSGQIDCTEFLVAAMDAKDCLNQIHFQQAFQYFDIDHSGAITFQEIAYFLEDTKESSQSIRKIFRQVDQNNDGNISKAQFVKLLMDQTKKKIKTMQSMKKQQLQLQKQNKKQNNDPFKQKRQQAPVKLNPKTNDQSSNVLRKSSLTKSNNLVKTQKKQKNVIIKDIKQTIVKSRP